MLDFSSRESATDDSWSRQVGTQRSDCWISFGGNVGDVRATFDAALALLSLHCQIQLENRSGLYRTSPMGVQAGNSYLNSVCGLTTTLSPQELLKVLQKVENQLGRIRDLRWGPRTLDLDLLSYGNRVLDLPDLILPHPALTYRRFVLDPLVEIDAKWKHPTCPLSAGQLLQRLKARPLQIAINDATAEQIETLTEKLGTKFPDARFVAGSTNSETSLSIQTAGRRPAGCGAAIDLRRSPGDLLEQLASALTAIFDEPERISDW